MSSYKIILDNGGGITLQLGLDYAHYYNDADQAARDLRAYIADGTTDGWDGHDEDAATLDPTDEEIRNGGYRIFTDIANLQSDSDLAWGRNESDLAQALEA